MTRKNCGKSSFSLIGFLFKEQMVRTSTAGNAKNNRQVFEKKQDGVECKESKIMVFRKGRRERKAKVGN